MMQEAGISVENIKEAIRFSDKDGDGSVDYQEFLDAINTMDEATVKRDSWELTARIRTLETSSESYAEELSKTVDGVSSSMLSEVNRFEKELKQMCRDVEAKLDAAIAQIS